MSEVKSKCCNAPVEKFHQIVGEWPNLTVNKWIVCTQCAAFCDVSPAPSDGAEEGK